MANYDKAYQIGRKNEGGYVFSKTDKGGETYCGVSRVNWPDWAGWAIIDGYKHNSGGSIPKGTIFNNPTLEEQLHDFYKTNFWDRICGDKIESDSVAAYIYDWSLTSGGCRKKIQQNLGLDADGVFGPATVAAINGKPNMLDFLRSLRVAYYNRIVEKYPDQQCFLEGWLNRANSLYTLLS